jgi:dTDP-4-amino-4,6-dideoxygalactose transaminase
MGAAWDGKKSGSFGTAACFSTQTYKHMNSGEGGLLVTDDPDLIARAILFGFLHAIRTPYLQARHGGF